NHNILQLDDITGQGLSVDTFNRIMHGAGNLMTADAKNEFRRGASQFIDLPLARQGKGDEAIDILPPDRNHSTGSMMQAETITSHTTLRGPNIGLQGPQ